MTQAEDVWRPTGTCPNCGKTEYGRYQVDTETGDVVGKAMGRRCDGNCTSEEVDAAERG
jgi:hypothetical protein